MASKDFGGSIPPSERTRMEGGDKQSRKRTAKKKLLGGVAKPKTVPNLGNQSGTGGRRTPPSLISGRRKLRGGSLLADTASVARTAKKSLLGV